MNAMITPHPFTTSLRAFHANPAVQSKYLARIRAHAAADEIAQGFYWEKGRGCAVGCTIHGSDHHAYEDELGIPQILARLEDRLFESMAPSDAKLWPERFLAAIPLGADLSLVWPRFAVWLLVDETDGVIRFAKREASIAAIREVAALYQRMIDGESVTHADLLDASNRAWAARSADDAADAAAYAADAAYAAAYATYADATYADATADAAADATYADAAAAYAAYAAAYAAADAYATYADATADAARRRFTLRAGDKLVGLLAMAPHPGTPTMASDTPSTPTVPAPEPDREAAEQAATDHRERLASIGRCIPHMADVGGIWPRDVEYLLATIRRQEIELSESRAALQRAEAALEPFANFALKWDAAPLRNYNDTIYAIHSGTEHEAEFRLSDCRRALASRSRPEKEEPSHG